MRAAGQLVEGNSNWMVLKSRSVHQQIRRTEIKQGADRTREIQTHIQDYAVADRTARQSKQAINVVRENPDSKTRTRSDDQNPMESSGGQTSNRNTTGQKRKKGKKKCILHNKH